MKFRTTRLLLTILAAVLVPVSLMAADITVYDWNAGNGDWRTTANWTPTGYPSGANHWAVIDSNLGTDVQVTLNAQMSQITLNRLVVDQGDGLMIKNGDYGNQLTFYTTSGVTPAQGPRIVNNGFIQLNSTYNAANQTNIYTSGANLVIEGTGILELIGPHSNIKSSDGKGFNNQAGHTIQGTGELVGNNHNYGTIMAKYGTLSLSPHTYNHGILSASPGAMLELQNWVKGYSGGQINPNGGTVKLTGSASTSYNNRFGAGDIQVASDHTMYGTNRLDPGAVMNVTDKRLSVTDNHVDPNYQTAVIENNGEIRLNYTAGKAAYLGSNTIYATQATLTGNGRVILGGYESGFAGAIINGKFLNDVEHTIEGGGQIRAAMTNNGTIIANNGRLEISADMSGNGTIRAENGGQLYFTTGYSHARTMSTGDLILAQNSGLTVDGGGPSGLLTLEVKGDFTIGLTDESRWKWLDNTLLRMSGLDRLHFLEVAGDSTGGSTGNFAIPDLEISGNIALVDLIDNGNRHSPEALFVESLELLEGSTLNLNDLALYTMLDGELHLVTPQDIGIFGAGNIINAAVAPVPLPGTVWLLGAGLLPLGWLRRKIQR